ncbi:MAG: MotA/TolQ/ExbB proton channel family protein [Pseudomonadota bacterium]|nr:MotA/TolQ/ExbB proton channel family protein [Pseudomonadota bacterium]
MILLFAGLTLAQDAPAAPSGTLEAAYQKEYAYLLAEKQELAGRVAEVERDSAERIAAADEELADLQAKLVATGRRADRAEDDFDALEREASTMDDAEALLDTTLRQAAETLEMPAPDDPAVALPSVFDAAAGQVEGAAFTGWRDGEFFLPGGEQVSGRVYALGQIGAWGASPAASGALAPAGEGRMQLRQEFGRATAAALSGAVAPKSLELQLFEAERGAEEAEKQGGLGELLNEAGTMGQVLFGLGVLSATLVVVRGITLLFARRGGQPLVDAVNRHVRAGRSDLAHGLLARRGGPLARVLRAILGAGDRPPEELARVVDEAILLETPGVDRFASALVVITAGSPLLGLLGTVTGMIATFDVITEHGTGNPKLMSAGIAEALVCTALGLAVAIPTLLAGNVLASVADSIKNTIERASLAMVNALDQAARLLDEESRVDAPPALRARSAGAADD